mmetsp:Transcript_3703/g.5850  ORF Transcript_3703/g.5850 Transcript_3703/m.5850 type:complete len:97 (+) Transcript_3703:1441-1731(+)
MRKRLCFLPVEEMEARKLSPAVARMQLQKKTKNTDEIKNTAINQSFLSDNSGGAPQKNMLVIPEGKQIESLDNEEGIIIRSNSSGEDALDADIENT